MGSYGTGKPLDWRQPMEAALGAAGLAADHQDVPIGAVVLDPGGTVVAVAGNERELTGDPTAHAEVLAIRRAAEGRGSWRLDDHTLVVTLEPCTMCAGAIVAARIRTLVFGAYDPKAGAVASLWDVVRDSRLNHRVEVVGGILEQRCGDLIRDFFATHRAPGEFQA
ncbi:tRNA-specific adenosine deaminase [Microlunatus endophyticus]|uniref:tRNA-specific adenosine deaminase n=1 Tax=Microlunatus endophyticus TaxID=1716077 RepID=A0A917W7K7_9ACTN|nr:nucleoside deaminase [Microlunatus endophyticus]GGL74679.1 tRNA-specific adenosine deaminase [Microlunatus endophyticus]